MENQPVADLGDGSIFVTEADESDGTVALYAPETAVITNIEYDHMEHFDSREDMENCFAQCIAQTKQHVIYCADDNAACRLAQAAPQAISYGLSADATIRGKRIRNLPNTTFFDVYNQNQLLGRVQLPIHGTHNVTNALGAFAALAQYGITFAQYAEAMRVFPSVKRRFETCGTCQQALVISDYAHHPTEIKAVLETAQAMQHNRIVCIFQPHRYTRTRALKHLFADAFTGASTLVLCPVYAASEPPIPGGTSRDLLAVLQHGTSYEVLEATDLDHAWELAQQCVQKDDLLLLLGAGDIDQLAQQCRKRSAS